MVASTKPLATAYGSFESARDAVNLGAFAYVEKLGPPADLVRHVHRAAGAWMADALQRSEEKYRQLVDSVQAIVWRSDPVNVEQQGLLVALRELTGSLQRLYGLPCTLSCPQPVVVHDLEVAAHVYRIAQEALVNAFRHAQASRVEVRLEAHEASIALTVRDNGIGFSATEPRRQGMGLRIMNYRAHMISGTFDVQSEPGHGTVVLCRFPYLSVQPLAE